MRNLDVSRVLIACVLAATPAARAQLPVIPGLIGFGVDTPAGRGGRVIHVMNLNPSGAGSLDACMRATGPRVCVFDVSGTIRMTHNLVINQPFITVAGQTAPSPGINIRGVGIAITTHDVLIQHLRLRVGDDPDGPAGTNRDAIDISNLTTPPNNIVVDHCSLSWSIDEAFSVWYEAGDVTLRNLIIAEALDDSIHIDEGATTPDTHGFGPLFGTSTGRVMGYGSLLAHMRARQPMSITARFVWANNVHYDRSQMFSHLHNRGGILSNNSFVGNVYIEGPSVYAWADGRRPITLHSEFMAGSHLYLEDNAWSRMAVTDQWDLISNDAALPREMVEVAVPPIWLPGLTVVPTAGDRARDWVLDNAGARPLDRDVVDTRIVSEVRDGTGHVINCVSPDGSERCMLNAGGWPTIAENTRVAEPPADPDGDVDGDGYTNLEEWLHEQAAALEPAPETEQFVFAPDPWLGDRHNFTEITPSRWRVVEDRGDLRYAIMTSSYEGGAGSQLGEAAIVRERTYRDFDLEVSIRTPEDATNTGADADIVFGYTGPDDYYYAMLNRGPGLTGLYRIQGGARTEIATFAGIGIPDANYHRYALAHHAGHVVVSRDDETLLDLSDLQVPEGSIGIGSFNDAAFFDDLAVMTPIGTDAGLEEHLDGAIGTDAGTVTTAAGCGCAVARRRSIAIVPLLLGLGLLALRRRRSALALPRRTQ